MNPFLEVHGFGVEITCKKEPVSVLLAGDEQATPALLQRRDYNHFGTRHRSMMRYCATYPGSVGFVISQDGDVRAITQVQNQLVMWENIKLQRDINSVLSFIKKANKATFAEETNLDNS